QSKGTTFIHGMPAKHRRAATMPAGSLVTLSSSTWNRAGSISTKSYSGTTQIKVTPGASRKVITAQSAPATAGPAATTFPIAFPTTSPTAPLQRLPTTFAGTGTITIVDPSTMPTLSSPGPAGTTAAAVIASLKSDTDPSFRTPPKPNTAPGPFTGTGTLILGAISMIPTYSYERYGVSMWLVAAFILLPVWCALALA